MGVGQQGPLVAQDFELHPIGPGVFELQEDFAAQSGDTDGIVGREAAGRIRQNRVAAGVDEIEEIFSLGVDQSLTAHGHGDALGPGGVECLGHALVGGVFAGANDQPA